MTNADLGRTGWTLAYRKPTGPHFQRIDLDLTWSQAFYAAGMLATLRPDLQVYYTTNATHETRQTVDIAQGTLPAYYADDHRNIMVDSGKRIAVRETGALDPRLCILPRAVAADAWQRNIHGAIRF